MDFLVQNEVGHEKYGIYAALFSLSFLFINLSDLGINLYVTKRIANNPEKARDFFSNTFTIKILLCFIYPAFMLLVGWLLGYEKQELYFLLLLSFVQAVLQTVYFFRANFQANQFFKIDAFASVADKIILIFIVAVLLAHQITIEKFIYSQLFSSVFIFIIFYFVIIKLYGFIKPRLQVFALKEILRLSLPFALIGILYAVNERVDMVMLERLGKAEGEKFAGLYAGAYRWLDAFMMYLWTIMPIFFAKFAIHHKEPVQQQKLFETGQVLSSIPMLFISVFVFFYGEKLFWLFDKSTQGEIFIMNSVLRILFVSALIHGFFAIYGTLLNSTGHEKNMGKLVLSGILINICLNWIFIPDYGPIAAAYATLASSIFLSILYVIYFHKKTKVAVPYAVLFKLVVISLVFTLVFYLLTLSSLSWYINTAIAGIFLLGITYISGVGGIRQAIKNN